MVIPRRRLNTLNDLAAKLVKRRIPSNPDGTVALRHAKAKANHAAYLLDDRGGSKMIPIAYGENHSRSHGMSAIHAERDVMRRVSRNATRNKSYSLLVIKVSNRVGLFGDSNCCLRCQWMLVQSPVRISRVYYSTPNGIEMGKPGFMTPHLCEWDRKIEGCAENYCAQLGIHCEDDADEEEESGALRCFL